MPDLTPQQSLEAALLKDSPLHEIQRDSLAELFRRINDGLVSGLPNEIPDSDLDEICAEFRSRLFSFAAEQDKKAAQGATPKRRGPKIKQDLSILDDL